MVNGIGSLFATGLGFVSNKFYNLIGQHWDYKLLRTPLLRMHLLRTPTSSGGSRELERGDLVKIARRAREKVS